MVFFIKISILFILSFFVNGISFAHPLDTLYTDLYVLKNNKNNELKNFKTNSL